MELTPLSFRADVAEYQRQADRLLEQWRTGNPGARRIVRTRHPRFLDDTIKWLPKNLSDAEVESTPFDAADAQLTIARWYDFADWPRLVDHVNAAAEDDSPVQRFEAAVDAVVAGDLAVLDSLLLKYPDLVSARSARVTHFDPPAHRATLLHYVAANGVEGHHQVTPPNAVDIAGRLLRAGAEPDAIAYIARSRSPRSTDTLTPCACCSMRARIRIATTRRAITCIRRRCIRRRSPVMRA